MATKSGIRRLFFKAGLPSGALALVAASALTALALLVVATQTSAAMFTVNSTADTDDLVCNAAPDCTLREAINAANAAPGPDTIDFSVSGTITLGSTLPNVTDTTGLTTIDGAGQSITVSGNNSVRVMIVDLGASLDLRNLTIANGLANVSGDNFGGGILNNGTLTMTTSTLTNNFAVFGGGIFNTGTLTLTSSTVSRTVALPLITPVGDSAAFGGGIDNRAIAMLTNSTVSVLAAANEGGGILNQGTLNLTNSTVSGNSGVNTGGGIDNLAGTLSLANSTVSGNSAAFGAGGGIVNYPAAVATVKNTIVANSTSGGDCSGTITSLGHNLSSDNSCGLDSDGANPDTTDGDWINTDPVLGALANNGGPTDTHALLTGSPAIPANRPARRHPAAGRGQQQ
jgi:CSLREA domain-containing protein